MEISDMVTQSPLAGEANRLEKRITKGSDRPTDVGPHSLGKLIEWKRHLPEVGRTTYSMFPLAGEANRMET